MSINKDDVNKNKDSGTMLERLWKSHPWQYDIATTSNVSPTCTNQTHGSDSTTTATNSCWQGDASAPAAVTAYDDVSLGGEQDEQQQQYGDNSTESCPPPPLDLLDLDFDNPEEAQALKDLIEEEVLAMWDEQGLYQDLPEIRMEILASVVRTKFDALREEQDALKQELRLKRMSAVGSVGSMDMIAEEEEEEETSSDEEEHKQHPQKILLGKENSSPTGKEKEAMALDVLEELQARLAQMDTSDHHWVEAQGRFGVMPPEEVKIKDIHAFNKYKLHDAVERRVSQIFTGDHHVVEAFSPNLVDENSNDAKDQKLHPHERQPRRASMPDSLPSQEPPRQRQQKQVSPELKERLSVSFSAFDAFVQQNKHLQLEDEWTVEEEILEMPNLKRFASEMNSMVKQFNGTALTPKASPDEEESFIEVTVVDPDAFSHRILRGREQQQHQQSQQQQQEDDADGSPIEAPQRKTPPRTISKEASYMEVTVYDEDDMEHTRRPRESMITHSGIMQANNRQATSEDHMHATLNGAFPTITTTTNVDDDDITQITFDHTMDGALSSTHDHKLATAYLNKDKNRNTRQNSHSPGNKKSNNNSSARGNRGVPSSPRKSRSAVDSNHTDPTRDTTTHMDESSVSQRQGGSSLASSSDGSANLNALNKAVAKILRVNIWSPNEAVVQSALERLSDAARRGSAQRSNIARLGGVMAIVRAMQMHPANADIQVHACEALEALSVEDDTQVAIAEVGGMSAIVQAMQGHPDDRRLQAAACKALAPVTSPNESGDENGTTSMSDSDDEDNPTGGVIKTLVTAMTRYPQDSEIQAKAFGALANLCLDNQQRLQELSESGGLTAMTLALQRPWKNKMEQHESISTLSILLRSLAELDNSQHSC